MIKPILYDNTARMVVDEILSKDSDKMAILRMFCLTLAYRKILSRIDELVCEPLGYAEPKPDSKYGKDIIYLLYHSWEEYIKSNITNPLFHSNLKLYEACKPTERGVDNSKPVKRQEEMMQKSIRDTLNEVRGVIDSSDTKLRNIYEAVYSDRTFHSIFVSTVKDYLNNYETGPGSAYVRKKLRNRLVRSMERVGYTPDDTKLSVFSIVERGVLINQFLDALLPEFGLFKGWYEPTYSLLYDGPADQQYLLNSKHETTVTNQPTNSNSNSNEEMKMKNRDYTKPAIETVPFVYGQDARTLTDVDISADIAAMEAEVIALTETDNPLASQKDRAEQIKSHISELVKFADDRYKAANKKAD